MDWGCVQLKLLRAVSQRAILQRARQSPLGGCVLPLGLRIRVWWTIWRVSERNRPVIRPGGLSRHKVNLHAHGCPEEHCTAVALWQGWSHCCCSPLTSLSRSPLVRPHEWPLSPNALTEASHTGPEHGDKKVTNEQKDHAFISLIQTSYCRGPMLWSVFSNSCFMLSLVRFSKVDFDEGTRSQGGNMKYRRRQKTSTWLSDALQQDSRTPEKCATLESQGCARPLVKSINLLSEEIKTQKQIDRETFPGDSAWLEITVPAERAQFPWPNVFVLGWTTAPDNFFRDIICLSSSIIALY